MIPGLCVIYLCIFYTWLYCNHQTWYNKQCICVCLVCREEASAAAVLQYEEAQRHKHSQNEETSSLRPTQHHSGCVCVCFSLCMFYNSGDAQFISIMCLGGCSDDDDEASRGDEHFALRSPGRLSSVDTATTEPWIRADSSDTLRRLMSASEL